MIHRYEVYTWKPNGDEERASFTTKKRANNRYYNQLHTQPPGTHVQLNDLTEGVTLKEKTRHE